MTAQQQNTLPNISPEAYERLALLSFILADAPLPQQKYATASAAIQRTLAYIEAVETHSRSQAKQIEELTKQLEALKKAQ